MLRLVFLIILASCEQILKADDLDATLHFITFGFKITKEKTTKIKDVRVLRINEEGFIDEIFVKSFFFAQSGNSLNIVVKDLLSDENCYSDFFHISFYDNEASCIVEDIFEINKTSDGPLEICAKTVNSKKVFLDFVFNHFLEDLYEMYGDFSVVPKRNFLYDKKFVKAIKPMLENYFIFHRGLRQTVDSLNACLSQVKNFEDTNVQVKNFFDERRKYLIELNDSFLAIKEMRVFCFDVDENFAKMMVDILIFLEKCTDVLGLFEYDFLLEKQQVAAKIKEVKMFVVPDKFFNKKDSAILLRIFQNENPTSYAEKDFWFFQNKLYVSQDFCDICFEKNWSVKVFNSKEKPKTMTLELFKP